MFTKVGGETLAAPVFVAVEPLTKDYAETVRICSCNVLAEAAKAGSEALATRIFAAVAPLTKDCARTVKAAS